MLLADVVMGTVYRTLAVPEKAFHGVGRDKRTELIVPSILLGFVIDGGVGGELLPTFS